MNNPNNVNHNNQKLNFNFNFNFPTEECNKLLSKKRQNDDKKNKNFNVNLNLNLNLNRADNNINSPNNLYNNNSFVKLKNYEISNRSSKENKFSNQINLKDEIITPLTNNNFNFPFNKQENFATDKKLRFINLRNRSSNDLLKESFNKKYLGEDLNEAELDKKASFDFEKYSKNYQKIKNKFVDMNKLNEEKVDSQINKNIVKNCDFDFNLLDVF